MAVVVTVLLAATQTAAQEVTITEGMPVVLDGDTFLFVDAGPCGGDVTVRLWGIDSPEMTDWPWGAWSRGYLESIIDGQVIRCVSMEKDKYGRDVAECVRMRDNLPIGRAMIRAGWAVGYRVFLAGHPTAGEYVTDEADARMNQRGIWIDAPNRQL